MKYIKEAYNYCIGKSPICKLYYKWKNIEKSIEYFFGQKFTGASDEIDVSPKEEIVN